MRDSRSLFLELRGLRYHVRHWPGQSDRRIFLLHGWMDVSASFQFMVDAMDAGWDLYAPDWRGFGLTAWGPSDSYAFTDYVADLDQLLEHLQPDAPVNLLGHSLGGNAAAMYAGTRPERVARLVNLEGFGMGRTQPEQAPARLRRFLDELRAPPRLRAYPSFSALADRLQKNNPRLIRARAEFLAEHWGQRSGDGEVHLRSDPAHKMVNATLSRVEEWRAFWQAIEAPVLWVDAADSATPAQLKISPEEMADRRQAYRQLRHVTVQNAGHMLHHDQPEMVAALIEEFLS